jgi:hypothetical protein
MRPYRSVCRSKDVPVLSVLGGMVTLGLSLSGCLTGSAGSPDAGDDSSPESVAPLTDLQKAQVVLATLNMAQSLSDQAWSGIPAGGCDLSETTSSGDLATDAFAAAGPILCESAQTSAVTIQGCAGSPFSVSAGWSLIQGSLSRSSMSSGGLVTVEKSLQGLVVVVLVSGGDLAGSVSASCMLSKNYQVVSNSGVPVSTTLLARPQVGSGFVAGCTIGTESFDTTQLEALFASVGPSCPNI